MLAMYYPATKKIQAGKVAKAGHFIFSIGGNLYRRTETGFVKVCDTRIPRKFFSKPVSINPDWMVYEVTPHRYIGDWMFPVWDYMET